MISKLTPTKRKILQFIADGGDRGRMLLQVVASGGAWPRALHELRNAGCVEYAPTPADQPDRVRTTEMGRGML
jgi:hypothetical protein